MAIKEPTHNSSLVSKVITSVMYFCIVTIPLAFYLQTYDSCQIKITIFQMGGALILGGYLFRALDEHKLTKKRLLWDIAPFLYFLWGIFSYIHSPFKSNAPFDEVTRLLYYFGIFLTASDFFSSGKKLRVAANLLLMAVSTAIVYGFLQFAGLQYKFVNIRELFSAPVEEIFVSSIHITFGNPKFYLFLWIFSIIFIILRYKTLKKEQSVSSLLIISLITGIIYFIFEYFQGDPFGWGGAFGTRVFSTFGNPNFYAALLVLTAPMMLVYLFRARTVISRIMLALLFVTNIISLFVTGSKGGWLGIAGALFFFTLLWVKFVVSSKKVKISLLSFAILAVLIASIGVYNYSLKRKDSIRFRVLTWQSTLQMIKLNPVFGNGLGTFRLLYPEYRDREIFRIEGKHQTETQHPENEFLEIVNDQGLIGLGLFLWMLWVVLQRGFLRIKEILKTGSPTAPLDAYLLIGYLAGLIGLLFHNLFCVNLRFVSSGFFLWLFLGIINGSMRQDIKEKEAETNSPGLKIAAAKVAIVIFTGFSLILWGRFFLSDYHHNLGIGYSKQQLWDEAIIEYQTAVEYNPTFTMPRYFLGNVYMDRWAEGDAQRAFQQYDDVMRIAPNYVMVHYQRGMVYTKLKEYDQALACFTKALRLDPVYPNTYFRMGLIYIEQKKYDQALKSFQEAALLAPNIPDVYVNTGNVFMLLRNYREAEAQYRKALSLDEYHLNALRNLAYLLHNLHREQEARLLVEKLYRLNPFDKEVQQFLERPAH